MTPAITYRIWIAGDYSDAVRAVREWCASRGDCYAVSRCEYVYSGGSEAGVCVSRINYARFPEESEGLIARVEGLANLLADRLFQKSFSIETPTEMIYTQVKGPWS
jgi:hypothetical protein